MWDIFSVLIGSTGHSPALEVGRYFKGPVNKYFWLYGPLGLHHNCSVLPDSTKVTMDNIFSDKFSNKILLTKFRWLVGFDSLLKQFHYRVENLISLCSVLFLFSPPFQSFWKVNSKQKSHLGFQISPY